MIEIAAQVLGWVLLGAVVVCIVEAFRSDDWDNSAW